MTGRAQGSLRVASLQKAGLGRKTCPAGGGVKDILRRRLGAKRHTPLPCLHGSGANRGLPPSASCEATRARAAMETRIKSIEEALDSMKIKLDQELGKLESDKQAFLSATSDALQLQKVELGHVVEGARAEFNNLGSQQRQQQQNLEALYQQTQEAVLGLRTRVTDVEEEMKKDKGGRQEGRGYMPQKNMVPSVFSDKIEEWRQWQEDVEDFMDTANPGMKALLQEINALVEMEVDWHEDGTVGHPEKVRGDRVNVWRALKKLTQGEARKVVAAVKSEDGFRAWFQLRRRFEPSVAARHGAVLADFTNMVTKPAKNSTELMSMITDMDRKMKFLEDVTGEEVPGMMAKAVLIGILDPLTRQHTATLHTLQYDKLKPKVMEFASNATSSTGGKEAMQADRVEDYYGKRCGDRGGGEGETYFGSGLEGEEGGGFNALGSKGHGKQCFSCKGYGHFSRECPSKGKGKGKS